MRIAVMVIALVLMIILFFQSCTVMVGGEILGDEDTSAGGAVGLLMALMFVLGGAFSLGKPRISMIFFSIAGVLGLMGASASDFNDLTIWAIVSFLLAGMSYLALRELRKRDQAVVTGSVAESPSK